MEFCPYGQESLAEEGHLRSELSEMKHQALGYTWVKGIRKKESCMCKGPKVQDARVPEK